MLNDTVNEFTSAVSKRFGNPFVINFMFSWAFINYKAILVMFSATPIAQKLTVLEKEIWTSDYAKYGCGFIFPLAATLFILYALPFLVTHLEIFNAKVEKNRTEGKYRITDTIPLDPSEGARIKKDNRELSHMNESLLFEIKLKDKEIAKLKEEISDINSLNEENISEYKKLNNNLSTGNTSLSSQLDSSKKKVTRLEVELRETTANLESLQEKLTKREQEIKDLRQKPHPLTPDNINKQILALKRAAQYTVAKPPQPLIDSAAVSQALNVNPEVSESFNNSALLNIKQSDENK